MNVPKLLLALVLCSPVSFADDVDPNRLVVVAEAGKGVAITDANAKVLWKRRIGNVHDLHLLPNDHLLVNDGWRKVVELDLTKRVVWTYEAAKDVGRVEIHAFQRLPNGRTMVVESGPGRILEVEADGTVAKSIPLQVSKPSPHSDTRLVRKLENGDYLVAHEADQRVKRYDGKGNVVWDFAVPLFGREPAKGHGPEAWGGRTFSAIVLSNGNYLISTGNGHGVLEVTPEKEIVWRLKQNDLEGVTLAWVTTLQELPNGHVVVGNCHAGPKNPQIVEIDREKRVVWTWKNFEDFGNALPNSLVVDGERAVELRKAIAALSNVGR